MPHVDLSYGRSFPKSFKASQTADGLVRTKPRSVLYDPRYLTRAQHAYRLSESDLDSVKLLWPRSTTHDSTHVKFQRKLTRVLVHPVPSDVRRIEGSGEGAIGGSFDIILATRMADDGDPSYAWALFSDIRISS